MKPRGPLMTEHRLIEKMLKIASKEASRIREGKNPDPLLIDTVVDFIRTYADRTHHGKEEDILFRDLDKKKMSEADSRGMRELVDEHVFARTTVRELIAAKEQYVRADSAAVEVILEKLDILIRFYPDHIRKEDKVFFPDTEKYFTGEELDAMIEEFREFDRKMIHEKYEKLVKELESR